MQKKGFKRSLGGCSVMVSLGGVERGHCSFSCGKLDDGGSDSRHAYPPE